MEQELRCLCQLGQLKVRLPAAVREMSPRTRYERAAEIEPRAITAAIESPLNQSVKLEASSLQ